MKKKATALFLYSVDAVYVLLPFGLCGEAQRRTYNDASNMGEYLCPFPNTVLSQ